MSIVTKWSKDNGKLAIIGLGYVGIQLAVGFAKHSKVLGFDIDRELIANYRLGKDTTKEVGDQAVSTLPIEFICDEDPLNDVCIFIVTVPTPVYANNSPNLSALIDACNLIGRHLTEKALIVFESTVYPGATENVCIPCIERASLKKCGRDFFVGYSPERINPSDKLHRLNNICKIVSGADEYTLEEVKKLYSLIIDAPLHTAPSIKVAEASKLVENTQRDVNIAFINETTMALNAMGISMKDVLDAMKTKWNALLFSPGLVGGHCIAVDPYYLVSESTAHGYYPNITAQSRIVNDSMAEYISVIIIKAMCEAGVLISKSHVVILGLSYKENSPDIRNTQVKKIIDELKKYKIDITVCDPCVNSQKAQKELQIQIEPFFDVKDADCVLLAVAHKEFRALSIEQLSTLYKKEAENRRLFIDIPSAFDRAVMEQNKFIYRSL